ncbi:phospholipase A and acyltransferase 1-like [Onychostoma macrolepis]|uniref:LRAT domain-containing protein n=1 Tax=Onychostoma macrolepis TaxID=369639 RepID=A0A7J6D575_9TELE|nr:phospholipase A and acyltransferase 1-like [Onychostoma macrolepis]KAF4114418.1 hypothetical protein G5714_004641 [Onychostoma macrolepis]
MRAFWVQVFLTTFALHLTLPVHCQFDFGDLIAFNRTSKLNPNVTFYMHWAVYVGKGRVSGLENIKNDDEDVFHITGYVFPKGSDCIFGKMNEISGNPWKFNYLDGKIKLRSTDAMKKVIRQIHKNCWTWDLLMNNCEHVATYIRYGEKHFEQIGARSAALCKLKLPTFTYDGEEEL